MLRKYNSALKAAMLTSFLILVSQDNVYAANGVTDNGTCTINTATGAGHCEGNYTDIRNYTIDPSRWVSFVKAVGPTNYLFFQMEINKKYYSCSGGASMLDAWSTAMASTTHMWFSVDFNSTGQCTNLELDVSSVYR